MNNNSKGNLNILCNGVNVYSKNIKIYVINITIRAKHINGKYI